MNMYCIGIDPGASGAITVIQDTGVETFQLNPKKNTERDIADFLRSYENKSFAMLEQVHSMPKQGVVSTFNFGQSFGCLRGMLVALEIPFEMVRPMKWQTYMGCRSGGNKNVTKAKAQELFPKIKVIHAIADSLLLAEYCRRTRQIGEVK